MKYRCVICISLMAAHEGDALVYCISVRSICGDTARGSWGPLTHGESRYEEWWLQSAPPWRPPIPRPHISSLAQVANTLPVTDQITTDGRLPLVVDGGNLHFASQIASFAGHILLFQLFHLSLSGFTEIERYWEYGNIPARIRKIFFGLYVVQQLSQVS